jgi:small-conductance mechanosensitive channel
MAALIKEEMLLKVYRSHLIEWYSEIQLENRTTWKALLERLGLLAAAISALIAIGVALRRLTNSHVRDPDTRKMLFVSQRILLWLMIIFLVLMASAFDLSSLATFLGLLSAGLAVGLHDVFLSIAGHLLIVRRFRVRIGGLVQICGVTGEVTQLGLMEFELKEVDPSSGHRTGRLVFLSNSYVFVSPATPLFRQVNLPHMNTAPSNDLPISSSDLVAGRR